VVLKTPILALITSGVKQGRSDLILWFHLWCEWTKASTGENRWLSRLH